MSDERHDERPHLRPVPDIEDIESPPVIQKLEGNNVEQPPQQPAAPVIGLGDMAPPPPAVAGSIPQLGTHVLAVGGTTATGAAVGFLASGDPRGALIGAGVQLTLLGLAGSLFSAGRLPTWVRVGYGILGVGALLGSGYLVWTRR